MEVKCIMMSCYKFQVAGFRDFNSSLKINRSKNRQSSFSTLARLASEGGLGT
jgi:hypothetical protein